MLMADNGKCHTNDKHFTLLGLILKAGDPELAKIYCRRFLLAQDSLPAAEKVQTLFVLSGWEDLQKSIDLGDSFKAIEVRGRLLKMLNHIDTASPWSQHPALCGRTA